MSYNSTGSNVFEWISHIARKGANIIVAGERGSGKSAILDRLIDEVVPNSPEDKVFISLPRIPALKTRATENLCFSLTETKTAPIQALRMQQDRLLLDTVQNGQTLENIFLFHDISTCEERKGQYVFTLDLDGRESIAEKIEDFTAEISNDDVHREFLETIDFVIYTRTPNEGGKPVGLSKVCEVIVDADGKAGERVIWEYSDDDDNVFLQTDSPSRRRRERFFWCS